DVAPGIASVATAGEIDPQAAAAAVVHAEIPAGGRGTLKEDPPGAVPGGDAIEQGARPGRVADFNGGLRPELDRERFVGGRIEGGIVRNKGVLRTAHIIVTGGSVGVAD